MFLQLDFLGLLEASLDFIGFPSAQKWPDPDLEYKVNESTYPLVGNSWVHVTYAEYAAYDICGV